MASAKSDFDSRSLQISQPGDVQGSDNPIPLSPQWLLPKSAEGKTGIFPVESHGTRPLGHAGRLDTLKSPGVGDEGLENHKKKDVFRPSVLDMEYGRHDHWRDEERDSNSAARKDRWRNGDKELNDNRKVDRWTEPSGRHLGEARRAPPERWNDSGNRDANHDQRRESKWNVRWGRDDKEIDSGREKLTDTGKDVDLFVDKGPSNLLAHHGKDETEGGQYRPWRSASSNTRGRLDSTTQNQPLTPNKQSPAFGRGHAESGTPTFPFGRGKFNSGGSSVNMIRPHLQPMGSFSENVEASNGETSLRSYHRTKLLDIYRRMDMKLSRIFLDGAVQIPSLTEEEPMEPLAFCAPSPDELVILKGIDKGDIVNSGVPQVTKDGPMNRSSNDVMQSRRTNIGSREDLPNTMDYNKGGSIDNAKGEDGRSHPHGDVWRSPSIGERIHSTSHDLREKSLLSEARSSDMSRSQPQKDLNSEWDGSLADSPSSRKEGIKWQVSNNPVLKRQTSFLLEKEPENGRLSQSSPEDLVLYYKDPQGAIQGPFSGIDVIGWFEAGYFGIDLQVRLAGAPSDAPFSLLGDVMPHLRAKAVPPPGFGAPKLNEFADGQSSNFSSTGKIPMGSTDINVMKNQPRYIPGSAMEADNRFIESLMSGNKGSPLDKFPLSEGIQGYIGNNANALRSLGPEGGENAYLLAKAMSFERQKSLPSPYPYWHARDSPSLPKSEHPSLHPSTAENTHPQQPHSLNVDLMSILQGGDRSSSMANDVGVWTGFPRQGSLDPLKDKLDIHEGQNHPAQTAFGIQQQRMQQQNSSILTNPMENPASMLTAEKLLSAGLSQDPQLLSLLQQQYLMAAQSQSPVASQQLSLLDKLLLLKQQQKQEEQQQLLRQQQQQQQLLSQVLLEHQAQQRLAQSPHGQFPSACLSLGNASVDQPQIPPSPELFQIGSQGKIPPLMNEHVSNFGLPSNVSQDSSHIVGSKIPSVQLPHQILGNTVQQRWISPMPQEVEDIGSLMASTMAPTPPRIDNQSLQNIESVKIAASEVASDVPPGENQEKYVTSLTKVSCESVSLIPEQVTPPIESLEPLQRKGEQIFDESLVANEGKKVDVGQAKKSEKKSKKHKASKAQASDSVKGVSNSQQPNKSQVKTSNNRELKSEIQSNSRENRGHPLNAAGIDAQVLPVSMDSPDSESVKIKGESGQVVPITQLNPQLSTGTKAWKPAPGFKPKSLLEIQEEEQKRAQAEMAVYEMSTSLASMSVSTPWAGVVSNSDEKSFRENQQDPCDTESIVSSFGGSLNNKTKKSQPLDLSADYVSSKSTETAIENSDGGSHKPYVASVISHNELLDDDDFIEAKDTKKSRKKSAKAKSSASKVPAPSFSVDSGSGAISVSKGKNSGPVQQENEVLPAVPSGPSLGDFVLWKGEPANSSPAPAWSTETVKPSKTTSLRDILKEQEKKVFSVQHQMGQNIQKSAPNSTAKGSDSSWSISSSPPAKAATPIQINSLTGSQSKHKIDDDLFWGPIDQSKQESKQSDFPQLGSKRGSKNTPPKGTLLGSLSKQKSASGRGSDYSLSSSPASAHSKVKGKMGALTKESEAMDFRKWCESESFRLIGTKDTSFLEFCLKQSRSEAEVLLVENLGSYDPDHEFIEQILNYKDLLPADVLDIAFQGQNDQKSAGSGAGKTISGNAGHGVPKQNKATTPDVSTTTSKKKGKKGKKVSPSVLGFSVVSNRIMMGEIQTLED